MIVSCLFGGMPTAFFEFILQHRSLDNHTQFCSDYAQNATNAVVSIGRRYSCQIEVKDAKHARFVHILEILSIFLKELRCYNIYGIQQKEHCFKCIKQ